MKFSVWLQGLAPRELRLPRWNLASAISWMILIGMLHPDMSAGAPLFATPYLSFDDAHFPDAIAVADLNGDGKADLVSADIDAAQWNSVSVLLGNGEGTYAARTGYGTGGRAKSVAIGDLNGDGKLDLVTAESFSEAVSVMLGSGDGTFGAKTDFDAADSPVSVAIGDLNGDGKPDLVTANGPGSNTVSVLLGNGDGSFEGHIDYLAGDGPTFVGIGDLDADGKPDLVTANASSGTVSVLLGNGDGTFAAKVDFATGDGPVSVAIGDLDADGKPDLVTANSLSASVSVLRGIGDGTFAEKVDYNSGDGPASVALADLNGDGWLDVATANSSSATVSVLLGNGDGTLAAQAQYATGSSPVSVAVADLNGDHKPDLATANHNWFDPLFVLLGNGDGTFGTALTPHDGPGNSLAIGDLNGDGRPDLVTASGPVAIADFNGDSKPDLVAANGPLSVLLGNGDGTFAARVDYTAGPGSSAPSAALGSCPEPVSAAPSSRAQWFASRAAWGLNPERETPDTRHQMLGDSRAMSDATRKDWSNLVAPSASSGVSVLLGNGDGTFGASIDYSTGMNPNSLAVTDLNGDGKLDLAMTNIDVLSSVSVVLGNGDGTFAGRSDYGMGDLSWVTIGDFDLDGKPDLVTGSGPTVSLWLGNGDGTFAPGGDHNGRSDFISSVATGDLNGDGNVDVAAAGVDFYGNWVEVFLGNGDGSLSGFEWFPAGNCPQSLKIGDLNGDGKLDLVTASHCSGSVSVLLGNGDGTFSASVDYGGTASGPASVAIADLNLDGRADLATAGPGVVLLNTGEPPVPLAFDFKPEDLNLNSRGMWLTGYLRPPAPYLASQIDASSIRLNGAVAASTEHPAETEDHDSRLKVKFLRSEVSSTLMPGNHVPVMVTGKLAGQPFNGMDYIKVQGPKIHEPKEGDLLTPGTPMGVTWDTPSGHRVQSVALLLSLDDGLTWRVEDEGLLNVGSYSWTAPDTPTDHARLAVGVTYGVDETGVIPESELAVSDAFTILSPTDVRAARAVFALRPSNPMMGSLSVRFSLPTGAPATMSVYDVGGRRVASREVGSLGPGLHTVALGNPPPGVYVVQLSQAGRSLTARVAVLR